MNLKGSCVRVIFRLIPLGLLVCLGCFGTNVNDPEIAGAAVSYQLYLSRVSAEGSSFEQYRHVPSGLFVECGEGAQGKEKVRDQGVVRIPADQQIDTQQLANKLLDSYKDNSPVSFDKSAEDSSDATLGSIVLLLRGDSRFAEIRTSIASVVDGEDEGPRDVQKLIELLRGVPERTLCKREEFFGLAGR
jgi:hypothetical protein